MEFLANSAPQIFPLTFSLLPVKSQFFQIMSIDKEHLVFHRSMSKFNTSLSEWIPQLTKNNFSVVWTMKDYRNRVPFLMRLNYDSSLEVIRMAMETQHAFWPVLYLSKKAWTIIIKYIPYIEYGIYILWLTDNLPVSHNTPVVHCLSPSLTVNTPSK